MQIEPEESACWVREDKFNFEYVMSMGSASFQPNLIQELLRALSQ